uniref:G2/mitotic-specific cyclin-B3-like n=1 Tax=Jaculus jaculus TaxID=51337 RepID=UPI001E1B5F25|nr:G2/mitotic-specific cyclin-B3-like [Jaculus jaculus]
MPRQLPHKISNKEETTKYQSGNIVSSDHYLSKKVSPSQLFQSKKKDDIDSIKDVFKSLKRKTQILRFERNNLKKAKTYNVELVRVAASPTSVSNLGISNTSETQTTSKAPAFKEVLVLIEETPRIKSILKKPLKRCMTCDKVSKLEEPLTLLEEMDHDDEPDIQPVTFGKKYKPEESPITEDSVLVRQKEKKCTAQAIPLGSEQSEQHKIISNNQKLYTETLRFPTKSSILEQKKHTGAQKASFSMPVVSPKSSNETYSKELMALKEGCSNNKEFFIELFSSNSSTCEDNPIEDVSTFCRTCVSQKSLNLGEKEKSHIKNDSPPNLVHSQKYNNAQEVKFFNKLFEKKDSSPETGTNQERIVAEEQVFLLNKVVASCVNTSDDNESLIEQPLASQVHSCILEKAIKKFFDIQEKSSTEEMAVFKEQTIDTKAHFKDYLSLQENLRSEVVVFLKDLLACVENNRPGKEVIMKEPLAMQEKPYTNTEATICTKAHFEDDLALPQKLTPEVVMFLMDILACLQNTRKEKEVIMSEPLSLQEKPNTKTEATLNGSSTLNNSKRKLETPAKEILLWREKPIFEEDTPAEYSEAAVLEDPEEVVLQEALVVEEPLVLQEKTIYKIDTILKESLALEENPSIEKEANPKESLAFHDKLSIMKYNILKYPLAFQEKSNIEPPFKDTLTLNEKCTTFKESSFKHPFSIEENPTQDAILHKRIFISPVVNSSHVFKSAIESQKDKVSVFNMSSTAIKSSLWKADVQNLFSSVSRIQNKIQEDSDTLGKIELEDRDPLFNSVYTKKIFSYLKEREEKLILQKYMNRQTELSAYMRAILVDWLVEVQMNLEMSHETLYLAVKLVDHYLMKVFCTKRSLQILGSTAPWIAAKFEDPHRPCLNTFLYICAYKYQKHEMLAMEGRILKALNFDINILIAYNFLRLYALHLHASMRTLTLSRFICEMTLQEYDYIQEKPSKLSAACFLLALYMKNLKHWASSLEDCSGYQISELHPMVKKLNMAVVKIYHFPLIVKSF